MRHIKSLKLTLAALVLMLFTHTSVAGVWSHFKTLGVVKDPLNGQFFYVSVPGGLGTLGCPNASWLIINQNKAEVDNVKDPRILIMAAKLAGKRVRVFGVCNSASSAYFEVEWIMVE